MTVKSAFTNSDVAYINVTETYGGQNIEIKFSNEILELTAFWREWGPVFKSYDPTVMDTLRQAKVLHEVTK